MSDPEDPIIGEVASVLATWSPEDRVATERLWRVLQPIVRARAHAALQRNLRPRDLDTTALFHEAFIKLQQYGKRPNNTNHLLALCSWAIDKVLKREYERMKSLRSSGGPAHQQEFCEELHGASAPSTDELVLHAQCWQRLEALDERQHAVAIQRLWFDRTWKQIGQDLGIDESTARADFSNAMLLIRTLCQQRGGDASQRTGSA
ncbi:MAG: ECF-type sigma factor [Pseudomonadota bacterium]